MGSVFTRYKNLRWYIRYKDSEGEWTQEATELYGEDQRPAARRLLKNAERRVAAGGKVAKGPITVATWAQRWERGRKALEVADAAGDHGRLRYHVLPVIGKELLAEVRPRHIIEVVERMRRAKKAPKTVRNVYSVLRAVFRDAQLADLIESSPCILTRYQLGELTDKVQGWRATAVYSRDELEALISDGRIADDNRVMYALEGIGGLRHGEAAGLQWLHYDEAVKPLGRITVARSYDHAHTKTSRTRHMPVHPTLAAILADWRQFGWPAMIGRQPTPEDLIVPTPKRPRLAAGLMRNKTYSYKELQTDLATLGFRARRGHDLRRTMISLARMDGARKDLLELCTHTPHKDAAIDLYTTIEWPVLCAEVSKMRVSRRESGEVAKQEEPLASRLLRVREFAEEMALRVVEAPGIEPGSESLSAVHPT